MRESRRSTDRRHFPALLSVLRRALAVVVWGGIWVASLLVGAFVVLGTATVWEWPVGLWTSGLIAAVVNTTEAPV